MSEIMIDLETLSVRPNAVILTIGAIKFNRNDKWDFNKTYIEQPNINTFYRRITIQSCINIGLRTDPETEQFWLDQDNDVKYEALHHPDRVNIEVALKDFTNWVGYSKLIWGHGDDFDCPILSEAYKHCNMEVPWNFWNTRDTRTLFDIAKIYQKDLPNNNKHHALHDCYRQIIGVQKCIKKLNL